MLVKTPKLKILIKFTDFARSHLASVARVVERAPHEHEVPGSIREMISPSVFFAFVDRAHYPQASSASLAVKNLDNGEKL